MNKQDDPYEGVAHRLLEYELFREMDEPDMFILVLKTRPPGREAIEACFELSTEDIVNLAKRFGEEAGKIVTYGLPGAA